MSVAPPATIPAPRAARPLAAFAALAFVVLLAAACDINWSYNRNFGAVIEPGAGRASLEIYREPRRFMHEVYLQMGIAPVADLIYAGGNGPLARVPTLCVEGFCVGGTWLSDQWHALIYEREGDLTSALNDAQASLDCLALTLISYGTWAPNWTHKSVGCIIGSL